MILLGIALRHGQGETVRLSVRPMRARMAPAREGSGPQGLPQVQEPVLECPSSRASRELDFRGVPDKGRGWGVGTSPSAILCGAFWSPLLRTRGGMIPAVRRGTWRDYSTHRKPVPEPLTIVSSKRIGERVLHNVSDPFWCFVRSQRGRWLPRRKRGLPIWAKFFALAGNEVWKRRVRGGRRAKAHPVQCALPTPAWLVRHSFAAPLGKNRRGFLSLLFESHNKSSLGRGNSPFNRSRKAGFTHEMACECVDDVRKSARFLLRRGAHFMGSPHLLCVTARY